MLCLRCTSYHGNLSILHWNYIWKYHRESSWTRTPSLTALFMFYYLLIISEFFLNFFNLKKKSVVIFTYKNVLQSTKIFWLYYIITVTKTMVEKNVSYFKSIVFSLRSYFFIQLLLFVILTSKITQKWLKTHHMIIKFQKGGHTQ